MSIDINKITRRISSDLRMISLDTYCSDQAYHSAVSCYILGLTGRRLDAKEMHNIFTRVKFCSHNELAKDLVRMMYGSKL
ncbi:MAG: hypothetical protein RR646_04345 [Erysipelotrichaceae bacterium]